MSQYSIEQSSELIILPKTREYFNEVMQSYDVIDERIKDKSLELVLESVA